MNPQAIPFPRAIGLVCTAALAFQAAAHCPGLWIPLVVYAGCVFALRRAATSRPPFNLGLLVAGLPVASASRHPQRQAPAHVVNPST